MPPFNAYWGAELTGGGVGAADKIPTASLADKDAVFVLRLSDLQTYIYAVDDDLGGTENSPSLLKPDDESGNKRLTLLGLTVPNTGLRLLDTNASNYINLKWNENDTSDRTLNVLVNGADRTLDLNESLKIVDGQDIELHASGGEKAQLAIDTQNAERTLTLNENFTIGDGTNITITGVTAARTITLNENLTIGDGTDITITGVTAARTLTLNENLTIGDGTDITLTGVTQANTLTLYESLTLGDGNDGTLTFKQASKALNVEGTNLIPYTGWPLTPGVTLSFVGSTTRTLTVTDGGSAYYYCQGVKYILGGNKAVQLGGSSTEGLWYIYFSGATLTASQTIWDFAAEDKVMVAMVYWDATNTKALIVGYELHNFFMDGSTHARLHNGGGTVWESGLLVSDAGSQNIDVSAGDVWDQDIEITITDGSGSSLFEQVLSPAELPVYYRSGASAWRIYETTGGGKANATDAGYVNSNNLHYNKLNGTWASTPAGGAKHVAYYVIATNDQTEPIALIMGQRQDTTLANAKENNVFSGLSLSGLPFQEMVVLARLILKETGSGVYYTLEDIVDLRATNTVGNITSPLITDHGGLGGLGDDDHAQYILVDGSRAMTGNLTVAANSITVGKASTTTGTLVLHDSNSANTITLTVPDISAGSLTFTLPPTDGDNTNLLQTNGSGVLTWTAAGAGDVTAAAALTDHLIVRGDVAAKAVQTTGIAIDDSDNMSGVTSLIIDDAGNIGSASDTDAIAITAAGILSFSGQSGCGVHLSANQTIPNAEWTKLAFATEDWDVQNEFDNTYVVGTADATEANKLHDVDGGFTSGMVGATVWNTTDNTYTTVSGFVDNGELDLTDDIMVNGEGYVIYWARFTVTVAGKYSVGLTGSIDGLDDQDGWFTAFYKNGALTGPTFGGAQAKNAATPVASAAGVFDLAISDYIEGWIYHAHGSVRVAGSAAHLNQMQIVKVG